MEVDIHAGARGAAAVDGLGDVELLQRRVDEVGLCRAVVVRRAVDNLAGGLGSSQSGSGLLK